MSRIQLALNVSDLDQAVAFYQKLFATAPAKVRPGYANFAIAEPPLKLVLFETGAAAGAGTLLLPRGAGQGVGRGRGHPLGDLHGARRRRRAVHHLLLRGTRVDETASA